MMPLGLTGRTLQKFIAPLASLRLTVTLFALSIFLVFAGTLAQANQGPNVALTLLEAYQHPFSGFGTGLMAFQHGKESSKGSLFYRTATNREDRASTMAYGSQNGSMSFGFQRDDQDAD